MHKLDAFVHVVTSVTTLAWRDMPDSTFRIRRRQVHLDFHTSPLISDLAVDFDATEFAASMQRANVDSVTVFSRCHHGMCYYPTKVGTPHPALGNRDLLEEKIEALHRLGIKAPIYTTVAWDEEIARTKPAWRMLREDGAFARCLNPDTSRPPQPGGWHFVDWMNEDYQAFLEAQVRELAERYPIDGMFFDIVFFDWRAHYSASCWEWRRRWKLEGNSDEEFVRFQSQAQAHFSKRFSGLIRRYAKGATVFYNAALETHADGAGVRARYAQNTHLEIESLPSGFWGYHHFPRLARGPGRWGKPWIGMTGRFQRMWGDFGGIKPVPALEYECFRSQALGGGNSVGDHLPPRGRLDPLAISVIGEVYKQCEQAELFYRNSRPCPEIGIVSASHPKHPVNLSAASDEGAVMMCDEAHYDSTLLDEDSDLSAFSVVMLPDSAVVTPKLKSRLRAYFRHGGKLLVSFQGGCDARGKWSLDFLPVGIEGLVKKYPTYWRARAPLQRALGGGERVVYSQGLNITPGKGVRVLVDRALPYFNRSDLEFTSHFQAPSIAPRDRFPAVVANERFVFFADPIFREYRQAGNIALRLGWNCAIRRLIGAPRIGDGLPTTINVFSCRRGRDLLVTLLHYVPVRKAMEIDVLEERMGFAGEILRIPTAKRICVHGHAEELAGSGPGEFALPVAKGRLLLEVPGFFP